MICPCMENYVTLGLIKNYRVMADKNNHLVIMAGGVGSRFWPMSTAARPKQFIDVLGVGRSLLQLTYDRFKGICLPENVWVVTNKDYAESCREQLPDVPAENILLEPPRCRAAFQFPSSRWWRGGWPCAPSRCRQSESRPKTAAAFRSVWFCPRPGG